MPQPSAFQIKKNALYRTRTLALELDGHRLYQLGNSIKSKFISNGILYSRPYIVSAGGVGGGEHLMELSSTLKKMG